MSTNLHACLPACSLGGTPCTPASLHAYRPASFVSVRVVSACANFLPTCMIMCKHTCMHACMCGLACILSAYLRTTWLRGCTHACLRACLQPACMHACMLACPLPAACLSMCLPNTRHGCQIGNRGEANLKYCRQKRNDMQYICWPLLVKSSLQMKAPPHKPIQIFEGSSWVEPD